MISNYKIGSGYDRDSAALKLRSNAPYTETRSGERIAGKLKLTEEKPPFKPLLANRLLAAQTETDLSRLRSQMESVSLKAGEVVYQPEGDSNFIYFPETAVFSQMNMLENGKTVETAMIGNEGVVGFSSVLGFETSNFWTQTLTSGNALRINAKTFKQEFGRGGFLQTSFLNYINAYITQISQRSVCNNHHCIENRFATWLLMLADRSRQNKLSLTQEQIASVLGVQRPSVTCIAQNLRSSGSINYIRGRIILNRQKLETMACECYSVIK